MSTYKHGDVVSDPEVTQEVDNPHPRIDTIAQQTSISVLHQQAIDERRETNHFLRGSATVKAPIFTNDGRFLSRRLKYLTSVLDKHWCRFAKELVMTKNQDPKFHGQKANIQEGDLVLMQERVPIGVWRKGIVTTI